MAKYIYIRLFAGLNYFVPEPLKQKNIRLTVFGKPSVKDVNESIGVPHTEFEMVTLNGEPTEIDKHVEENDQLVVYPPFCQLPINESDVSQNMELFPFRFVLDVHLGKLAAMLRLLGFNSVYNNKLQDNEIIEIAITENRIILSRDLGIFKHSKVKRGYFPRSQDPKIQIKEVVDRYGLNEYVKPFSRCIKCNGELMPIDKALIQHKIQEKTNLYYKEFYTCKNCNNTYWKGSHYDNMKELVQMYSQN